MKLKTMKRARVRLMMLRTFAVGEESNYTPTHKHLNSVTIPISKYDEESELNDLSMTNIRKEDDDVDNNNMKNLLNQRNNKCLMSLMSQRSCYSLPNH
ncbi:CLUMA_CG013944, isoform A [Clunio marinus]|uniref:CLUMA_CG013944, isoform A n=1 Tax=Clunio marinus TaxID=568069 RepID=A0A1J1IKB4_9DIPT|nr:CLUMA_CG013944, isoform A [Clunio marinus]